jgi:hypothetical protein
MIQTVQTPAAAATVALNLDAQKGGIPLASMTGGFAVKGTDGMTAIRLLANWKAPGMHVAGSATYVDEAHAKAGADGLKALFSSTVFSVATSAIGLSVRDVNIASAHSDAQLSFAVDDASIRNLIGRLPSLMTTN